MEWRLDLNWRAAAEVSSRGSRFQGNSVSISGMVGRGMVIVGMEIVGTEMVGSTGGSVGGGADVFVAGTGVRGTAVLVRGMEVRVGLTRVSVGMSVEVGPGTRVRRVAVTGSVGVIVGVRVAE